jgi:hypothetical protein
MDAKNNSIALYPEGAQHEIHSLPGVRLHFDSEIALALLTFDSERPKEREVPLHIVPGGIARDPVVVKKPPGALTEADTTGNPGEKKEDRAA